VGAAGDFEQVWRDRRDHLWRLALVLCGDDNLAVGRFT